MPVVCVAGLKTGKWAGDGRDERTLWEILFPYSHFSSLLHPPHPQRLQLQRRLNLFAVVLLSLGKLHLISSFDAIPCEPIFVTVGHWFSPSSNSQIKIILRLASWGSYGDVLKLRPIMIKSHIYICGITMSVSLCCSCFLRKNIKMEKAPVTQAVGVYARCEAWLVAFSFNQGVLGPKCGFIATWKHGRGARNFAEK